jgi:hypothetical protein
LRPRLRLRRRFRRLLRSLRRLQRGLQRYRRETRLSLADVRIAGRLELVRDLVPWYRTQDQSAIEQGRPWITFEATRILEARLSPRARVFEYGSGGSTLFFGRRVADVVSVEHDRGWLEATRSAVAGLAGVELILAEPRPPENDAEAAYTSSDPAFAGQTFVDYVTAVDRYANHHFDVLLVDGRARVHAFFRAEAKVRVGGLVILDDSERPTCRGALDAAAAAGWLEQGRFGPKPFGQKFGRTTVWTKTRDLEAGDAGSVATPSPVR